MDSSYQPYLFPEVEKPQSLVAHEGETPSELSASRVLLHLFLLAATAVTTTITGAVFSLEQGAETDSLIRGLLAPFIAIFRQTAEGNYAALAGGLLFTFTLLTILGAHELGHYFACRYYRIRATLPFFIPAPPLITPFGTFGAVIKIKEPICSRRALFDIGIAGPLAGFVFAVPASIIGLIFAKAAPPLPSAGMQFNDPLLFIIIIKYLGLPKVFLWNPVYWAAWGSLLVTALNLFPVGQLDGGHVLYAIAGERNHRWVSRAVTAALIVLTVLSILWHQSPVWLIWSLVLLFMLRMGHPPVAKFEPLGAGRIALAIFALIVFLLCFMPFPITIV